MCTFDKYVQSFYLMYRMIVCRIYCQINGKHIRTMAIVKSDLKKNKGVGSGTDISYKRLRDANKYGLYISYCRVSNAFFLFWMIAGQLFSFSFILSHVEQPRSWSRLQTKQSKNKSTMEKSTRHPKKKQSLK